MTTTSECPCLPGAPDHKCGEGGYKPPIAPGIYPGMSMADYLTAPAVSSSTLRQLSKLDGSVTPAHIKHGKPTTVTEAMRFGSLVHAVVFDQRGEYVISPYDSYRTKEARAWRDEKEAAGVNIVSDEWLEQAKAIAGAIADHPLAGPLFTGGKPEVTLFWEDSETGLMCKARFDYLRAVEDGRRLIVPDLKTADSAAPVKWAKKAADLGYAQQDVHYCDAAIANGLDVDPAFVFVVAEKAEPYLVNVLTVHEDDRKHARELNRRAMRLYAECLERDEWPGFAPSVTTVEFPGYHRYATEEFLSDVDN